MNKIDPLKDNVSKVEFVDHMGTDMSVVNAARVSFESMSEWDTVKNLDGSFHQELKEKDGKLISFLASNNHWTPFGHTAISLRLKAPIFIARQLAKHQVGFVWNEVSRRYVKSVPEFYWPKKLNSSAENVKQGSSGQAHEGSEYFIKDNRYYTDKLIDLYAMAVKAGVAPEDARMFLPVNMYTEWVWTGSIAAWARVCKLRIYPTAQGATQEYGKAIKAICESKFPVSFSALLANHE